jgi:nucleoid-associated protein YgaU
MQKDLKIGLILGLAIVSAAVLWLATRPSLSPEARIQDGRGTTTAGESPARRGAAPNPVTGLDSPERQAPETAAPRVSTHRTRADERFQSDTVARPVTYAQRQRFHIVRDGETLSKISYDYYGSAGKWRTIFEANRNTIKDANVVVPGTRLIIPN